MEVMMPAIIAGIFSVIVSLIANSSSNKKLVNDFKLEVTKNQAITDTKIEELTREVREHNGFAQKIPQLEEKITSINNKIDILHNK